MKVTKYGHACLLIEQGGTKIVTDPGSWNTVPDATGVHAVLITHEHGDHIDVAQVKQIIANNPGVRVITHEAAGKLLTEAGVAWEKIEPGSTTEVNGVTLESAGSEHAVIYGSSPCRNTGFLIGDLFVPGDALHDVPTGKVRVLALPTGGPWMKLAEAIDYAKKLKPEAVFPIHDALYTEEVQRGMIPRLVGGNLKDAGIEFIDLAKGASIEL